MIYTFLGRTGLKASVIGIGAGGPSRLGLGYGGSADDAVRLIRFGLDRGINVIDSAVTYGTEQIVGKAIKDCRPKVVLSTKATLGPYFGGLDGYRSIARLAARLGEVTSCVASGWALEERVNSSLRRLKTDYIDVFYLHSVTPAQYAPALARVLPTLIRLKETGKIRWIGITEAFPRDTTHRMLTRAANDGVFDCIMIGFNCLNQSGAALAAQAKRSRSGVIVMYAVRALRRQESLQVLMDKLVAFGCIEENDGDATRLVKMLKTHGVHSLPEAAIRFCRHELNPDVVLSGTGDTGHLESNIAACQAGPLPHVVSAEFRKLFSKLNSLTGGE
jgi:aryl-alcohol dehydrogenase-like predicted oxidoreductase